MTDKKVEGSTHGQPHPSIDGLFWDAAKREWVRNPAQAHAGVKWTGGAPK